MAIHDFGPGFSAEFDQVSETQWGDIFKEFDDGTIYQTWPWGAIRWGRDRLSHLTLRKGGEIVAAAQCWLFKVPVIGSGMAYVKCGPMWHKGPGDGDPQACRAAVRAMVAEYVEKRGLLLRIMPNKLAGVPDTGSFLAGQGFSICPGTPSPYRTRVFDLACSEADLRKGMQRQWHSNLKRAEKLPLSISEDRGSSMFDAFREVYAETVVRKKFRDNLEPDQLKDMQECFGEGARVDVLICSLDEEKMSGVIVCQTGRTAVVLFSANTAKGLQLHTSQYLWWHLVMILKARGVRWLDMGGIDPEGCPGTYQFKKGLAGASGEDVTCDHFEYCTNKGSRVFTTVSDCLRNVVSDPRKLLATS